MLHHATAVWVANASAARANAQAVTSDLVACATLPPAVDDAARLQMKYVTCCLQRGAQQIVLPASSEHARLSFGCQFGTAFRAVSRDAALARKLASLAASATACLWLGVATATAVLASHNAFRLLSFAFLFIGQIVCPMFIAVLSTHAWTARFGLGVFLCAAFFARHEYRHIVWIVRWVSSGMCIRTNSFMRIS